VCIALRGMGDGGLGDAFFQIAKTRNTLSSCTLSASVAVPASALCCLHVPAIVQHSLLSSPLHTPCDPPPPLPPILHPALAPSLCPQVAHYLVLTQLHSEDPAADLGKLRR
jgi:hypothetical protein